MIAMIVAIKGSCAWVGSTYAILSVEAMMVLCGSVYPYVVTINSGAFACVSKKCRGESHEQWVKDRISSTIATIKIRDPEAGKPVMLQRIDTGKELMNVLAHTLAT